MLIFANKSMPKASNSAAGAASYLIAELYMTSYELQDLDYETTRFCTRKPK